MKHTEENTNGGKEKADWLGVPGLEKWLRGAPSGLSLGIIPDLQAGETGNPDMPVGKAPKSLLSLSKGPRKEQPCTWEHLTTLTVLLQTNIMEKTATASHRYMSKDQVEDLHFLPCQAMMHPKTPNA